MVFRVLPEVLTAANGQTRCGQCGHVFDAWSAILVRPQDAATRSAVTLPVSAAVSSDIAGALLQHPSNDLPFLRSKPKVHRGWWLASLCAALLLLAQLAFDYRGELSVYFPALRHSMMGPCVGQFCVVPLPKRIELLGIESSDLQVDAQQSTWVLNVLLRNYATFAQALPHLEFTVLNARDEIISRRVFTPEQLWPEERDQRAFAPYSEETLRLRFTLSAADAHGYRLYLFHP
jgi:hypothetical protein